MTHIAATGFKLSTCCFAVVTLLALVEESPIVAQDKTPAGGLEIAEVEGTLQAVAGNRLKIKTEDGKDVIAVLDSRVTLSYTGTAVSSFLRPRLMVRFTAPFDQAGVPKAAIQEIEIFRPAKQRRMSREKLQEQTPGIYPVTKENKKDKAGDKNKDKTTPPPAGSQNYRIVGQLRMIGQGKAQVLAGNRPLIVSIADDVAVTVASGDTTFCVQGDEISIQGLRDAARPELVKAQSVEIKGVKPLGETEQSKQQNRTGSAQRPRGKLGDNKKKPTSKFP